MAVLEARQALLVPEIALRRLVPCLQAARAFDGGLSFSFRPLGSRPRGPFPGPFLIALLVSFSPLSPILQVLVFRLPYL